MTILLRLFKWIARIVIYTVATIVVLAVVAILFVGFTPFGAQFAANRIAALISMPDRTIAITAPSGLLTGHLRVADITVSDTKGIYASAQKLVVDWSPLALLSGTFEADIVSAQALTVARPPVVTVEKPATDSAEPFSLPVAIDIDALSLPDIDLGPEIAGKAYPLAADGAVKANNDSIALNLTVNRRDQAGARAIADILFAPADNRLTLKADITEPQGGLMAGMLRLPGEPAVNITLDGEGPLSDWAGKLTAALDGKPILAVDGRHQLTTAGLHHLDVKGGGTFDSLMPPVFRPLFSGQTALDLAIAVDASGGISIETGNVTTGSLLLAASGKLDPAGDNSLKANILGTAGPVDFRWPLADGEARLMISGIDLSVIGAASAAKLDLTAALDSLTLPQGTFNTLQLTAKSDAFDLGTRSGVLTTRLSVAETHFVSADLDRAIRGPLVVAAPVAITPEAIGFDGATIESASIGGTLNGRYTLASSTIDTAFKIFALPAVLPAAIATKFDTTIAAEGQLSAILGGKTSITGLNLKSGTIEAAGDVALEGETLTAALTGRLPDIGKLLTDAKGAAAFTLDATGPLSALGIQATVKADEATLAGRALTDLSIAIDGTADSAAPQAKVTASGALGGQTIDLDADLMSKDGATSLPTLKAQIGPNRIEGQLTFSPSFAPAGKLAFDLPDLSLVAALAGQAAAGDLKGTVDLASSNDVISATIKASGSRLSRDTVSIDKPVIDLTIDDLKALSAKGTIRAAEIVSGANRIADLTLDVTQSAGKTGFDLKAVYDDAPLLATGDVQTTDGNTVVALRSLSATPRRIPLKLATPGTVTISNGTATLSKMTIQTGQGSVTVSGTAGATLNIDAGIANLPATLVNTFVPSLGAEGIITGTLAVRGTAAAPAVDYKLAWANAAVAQTRAAGLGALSITANGRFADNKVQIDTGLSGGGLTVKGGGNVAVIGGNGLDLAFTGTLPFSAIAGQLAAQGLSMQGSAAVDVRIGGTTAAPAITGSITTSGATLIDVRRNIALNDLAVSVTLDRNQATISRLSAKLNQGGTISGSGSVGIAPGSNFPADISLTLAKAAYVDGTLLSTVIDGALTVKGPLLSNPVLAGTLKLGKTSITVPEKLPSSLADINVKHRNAPADVRAQTRKITKNEKPSGTSSSIGLDLTLDAPSQIFVRGRGIDAELGGSLVIRGTASNPVVSGGFEMRRGRLTILNKRLDFTEGTISFGGDLTPTLNMEATTTSSSTTVTVTVAGLANDPNVSFSSSPSLPQDEILAQLIFGQSMSKLSALQIAQLADAASQLAGGRSTSLFQSLRSNLGVDDLDISTDEKGQARVSAGRYINDKTYIELQGGGDSGGKAVINLDVGRGVKLRGSAGGDGAGSAGIFYEKEY